MRCVVFPSLYIKFFFILFYFVFLLLFNIIFYISFISMMMVGLHTCYCWLPWVLITDILTFIFNKIYLKNSLPLIFQSVASQQYIITQSTTKIKQKQQQNLLSRTKLMERILKEIKINMHMW